MMRTAYITKNELIDSLVLKTLRHQKDIESVVDSLPDGPLFASNWEDELDRRGEHDLARALIDGSTL